MTDVITVTDTVAVADPVTETVEVGYIAQTVSSSGGTMASTVTDETTYGVAKAVGTSTASAREDHTHGSPSLGATSTTAAAGNHAHAGVYDVAGTATSAVSSHVAAADPHGDRAYAVQRANHTGTQLASTVSNFAATVAATALLKASNLSDLASASAARTNLSVAPPIYPLSGYGLTAGTDHPSVFQKTAVLSNSDRFIGRILIPAGTPITNLWVAVTTAGTWDAVSTPNRLVLYDDTGVQLSATPDDPTIWTTAGWRGGALAAAQAAQGVDRFVYALLIMRGITGLSLPFPVNGADQGVWFSGGVGVTKRRALYSNGATVPASFDPTAFGTATSFLPPIFVS